MLGRCGRNSPSIYNVFRYVFDNPAGDFSETPLIGISLVDGKPVVKTPTVVNSSGFNLSIQASDMVDGTGNVTNYALEASGETKIDEEMKNDSFLSPQSQFGTVSGIYEYLRCGNDCFKRNHCAEIGESARLAEALGVEGAASLDEAAFTSNGLTVTFERTTDGKARAVVTPPNDENGDAPATFFMRVKVK